MKFDIDKYLNQIDAEEKQTQRYKNIGMHIFISFLTVILLITFLTIYKINRLDGTNVKMLNDAGYIYGYVAVNTDGLMDYCSTSGYIPKMYIYLFDKNFDNTIRYADDILSEYYDVKEIEQIKDLARSKVVEYIDEGYNNIRRKNPNMTKRDFCKMYDQNPERNVQNKISFFKENHADLFKD